VRVYMTAPAGRQVTVRYARSGDVLGVAALVGGPAQVSVQTLTDATLLMLNIHTLHTLGRADARVGWLVAEEVTRRLYDTLDALAGNVFGSVRQRIARHLLDLAATEQQNRTLVARVNQQELADAVGSVREVVTRVLRGMREDGLVRTGPDGIHLLDAAGLHATAWIAER
jgi:CRP/FNR family transcriptional regulator, cyclic AMP receptor protein